MKALLLLFCAIVAFAAPARDATRPAPDEAGEQRLVAIASELRCLVCQNESLAGSHAELAEDLRREIRSLIESGRSDAEIIDFMVGRYGDFVRYRPPLKASTLLLWFAPALMLVAALVALFASLRRRDRAIDAAPLAADELRRADRLLDDEESWR